MIMTDEQLNKIQQDLLKQIDKPLQLENLIKDTADKIARSLSTVGKAKIDFQDRTYMFRARHTDTTIILIIADELKFKILGEKYRPYFVKGEIQNNLTYQENLRAVCEAYFRHITGLIQPEVLN